MTDAALFPRLMGTIVGVIAIQAAASLRVEMVVVVAVVVVVVTEVVVDMVISVVVVAAEEEGMVMIVVCWGFCEMLFFLLLADWFRRRS